jgi:hypothetical protein
MLGEKELWDDEWRTPQCSRGPFFWRDKEKLSQFLTTDVKLTGRSLYENNFCYICSFLLFG